MVAGCRIVRRHTRCILEFFLVHPVQTESVTYISSRSELLSTFFYLIGFLIFVWWPVYRIGFLCTLAVGVAYFFGLGSKETVITLPATIFLYDFLFLSGATFRPLISRWRFYCPFIIGGASAIYYQIGFLIFVWWPVYRIGFLCTLAVGVAYFFGLGSKETVITLPATIFLYDFLFLSGATFRPLISRWRFYCPFIIGGASAIYY